MGIAIKYVIKKELVFTRAFFLNKGGDTLPLLRQVGCAHYERAFCHTL